jgi:hypothetical protein
LAPLLAVEKNKHLTGPSTGLHHIRGM